MAGMPVFAYIEKSEVYSACIGCPRPVASPHPSARTKMPRSRPNVQTWARGEVVVKRGPDETRRALLQTDRHHWLVSGLCVTSRRSSPTGPRTFPCSGSAQHYLARLRLPIRSRFATWPMRTTTTPAAHARLGHSGGSAATMDLRTRWQRPGVRLETPTRPMRTTITPAVQARSGHSGGSAAR